MAYLDGPPTDKGKGGKKRPNTKAKVTARQTARKESGMSAQKFYVKTRMAEAAKKGKTLDKAALRKKFQSGEVTRKGFGAPKKKTGGTGSSSTGSSSNKVGMGGNPNSNSNNNSRKAYGGKPAPTSWNNELWSLRGTKKHGNKNAAAWSADTYLRTGNERIGDKARKAKGRYGS